MCQYKHQPASVRLWVGIAMLAMGLVMASCQKPALAPASSVATDSTAIRSVQDDDPPEKPVKPGGDS